MDVKIEAEFKDLLDGLRKRNVKIKDNVTPEDIVNHFEDCLDANYKKEHGVVYTPEYLADFMVSKVINMHIQNNFDSVMEEGLEALSSDKLQELLSFIRRLKLCDPCVGAGVYLFSIIKVLEKLTTQVKSALGQESNKLEIKEHIIKNNIYAIDYDRNALEITKFRLWASLVEQGYDKKLEEFDCNLIYGDSLISLYETLPMYIKNTTDLPKESELDVDHEFGALKNTITLEKWNKAIEKYRKNKDNKSKAEIIAMSIKYWAEKDNPNNAPKSSKLTFKNLKSIDWDLEFMDVKQAGGFDLIIGNPPYVRGNNITEGTKKDLETLYTEIYTGVTDLCLYFFVQGMRNVKTNGIVSLITTNKWMTSDYGEKFRVWAKDEIYEIIDFGNKPMFDNAGVDVAITTLIKDSKYENVKYTKYSN